MANQIVQLTSQATLQRRLDEGFIKLVPITNDAVVRVHSADGSRWAAGAQAGGSQIQTVSHDTAPTRVAVRH